VVIICPWYLAGGHNTIRLFWLELKKALRELLASSSLFKFLGSQATLSATVVYSYLQQDLRFLLSRCRQYRNDILLSRLYRILLLCTIFPGTTILWIAITIVFVCSCCWNILRLTLLLVWYSGCAVFCQVCPRYGHSSSMRRSVSRGGCRLILLFPSEYTGYLLFVQYYFISGLRAAQFLHPVCAKQGRSLPRRYSLVCTR